HGRRDGQGRGSQLERGGAHFQTGAATGAFRNGTRSNDAPRIWLEPAPKWPPRISWYTERKSTAYLRLPEPSRAVRLGASPYRPPFTGSPIKSSGAAAP